MTISYKSKSLEKTVIAANSIVSSIVVATFILLFGFDKPVLDIRILHSIQIAAFVYFLIEKLARFLNSESKREFLRYYWFEIPLLLILLLVNIFAYKAQGLGTPARLRITALGLYLVFQVVDKLCRACVSFAATGKNPMRTLVISFIVLILGGSGFLMLPRSCANEQISFVDSLFTATSATCVTGLVTMDTGTDFTRMGQVVILVLMQLGGLGIVIFGAVFALLLGQAFSVRESVAMQDLLNTQTLGRISNMIGFIFLGTLTIEAIGALGMLNLWNGVEGMDLNQGQRIFYSIFHSVSAFCNAGFSLFNDSLIRYNRNWEVYGIFCPLIVLGGLGFGVLYNISNVAVSRIKLIAYKFFHPTEAFMDIVPKRLQLQTKIVVSTSLILIVLGAVGLLVVENNHPGSDGIDYSHGDNGKIYDAVFQSVTARTAGFNTVDNGQMSQASKLLTIILMLIGGSPGSTAGGIKTVTLVIIVMTAWATMRKRTDVEIFRRSIRYVIVGRAITVVAFFIVAFMLVSFTLCITERQSDFTMLDIMFESASALGTVGLSTGITASLTTAGKLIIIAAMLIGRLGPLTLLALLTFNMKVRNYNYPDEPVMVG